MKTIEELNNTEAVYALYLASEPFGESVAVDNPEAVREVVREAIAAILPDRDPDEVIEKMSASEPSAGALARACLNAVRELNDMPPQLKAQVHEVLVEPPQPDKLALDASLTLLALSALAMVLMSTLELDFETQERKEGQMTQKTQTLRLRFKGSEKVTKVLSFVATHLRL